MALFRHNTVHTFKVGKYQFSNHLLTVADEEVDDFIGVLKQLPGSELNQIKELNEDAIKNLERPVDVTRGPATSKDLISSQLKASEQETQKRVQADEAARLARLKEQASESAETDKSSDGTKVSK